MILTFERSTVEELLQHSVNSTSWRSLYGEKKTQKPGLWLIGDQGVYLMSNGDPGKLISKIGEGGPGKESHHVCYADQVNPETLDFDEWWSNKRASFGGDDGCDFLGEKVIRSALEASKGDKIALKVTPQYVEVAAPPKR